MQRCDAELCATASSAAVLCWILVDHLDPVIRFDHIVWWYDHLAVQPGSTTLLYHFARSAVNVRHLVRCGSMPDRLAALTQARSATCCLPRFKALDRSILTLRLAAGHLAGAAHLLCTVLESEEDRGA